MFIALLLRAMKRDVNLKRVAAFSKRLLQVIIKLHFLFLCLLIRYKITLLIFIRSDCTSAATTICLCMPFPSF